ncbi:protein phosphatase 2C domain-containing protein [Nocardioides sp. CER19]|uniref:PP2C family protein-serine/threonine phosphatase n=1 Tax=Nocardioides sp. CER19 TaxID=3038538 RepID=UPI0024479170|nr:protein phosphatase 2C domain-containing protein [Nocardioides sp. CER19]MDH2415636.1 protein phosphatase 2C domain-containing protein [Nocardioides sp. CER19]
MLRFDSAAASHVGLVRSGNEDAGFAAPYLQLVADGVGGSAAGEVASATTAYVVSALVAASPGADPQRVLRGAVLEAHRQLSAGVRRSPEWSGMATTLTAVVAHEDRFHLVHVGDSRAYLLRAGGLTQLTDDHTLVQSLVDDGSLSEDEAEEFPYRSVVLRSINGEAPVEPDISQLDLRVGDRLLLCSDGLSDLVSDEAIAAALEVPDRDDAAAALVDAALAAGGRDNVTCLVADVVDGPRISRDGRVVGALADPHLVVDPGAVKVPHSV